MKKRFVSILLALVMLFSLTACGGETESPSDSDSGTQSSPTGERTEPLVIRWGATGNGDANDVQIQGNQRIMDRIEEETNGMIVFEYYPSSQLGDATAMMDQVLMGTLDVVSAQPNIAATVWPEFNVLVFPFAYPDLQTYFDSMRSDELYNAFRDITMENNRAVYLGICSASYRGMQNTKHPIRSVEDMQGLTVRVQAGQIYSDMFTAMGATTSAISTSELYSALQQGVVDAEENPAAFALSNGFYEVAKYSTELNMVNSNAQNFMSTQMWNQLTDSEKEIVSAAFREEAEDAMMEFDEKLDDVYAEFEEYGIEVIRNSELTEEERQSFVDAQMGIWEQYSAEIDPDFYQMWLGYLQAAWEENGYTWTIT